MDITKNGDLVEIHFNPSKDCPFAADWVYVPLELATGGVFLSPVNPTAPSITINCDGSTMIMGQKLNKLSVLSQKLLEEFPPKEKVRGTRKRRS